MCRNEVYLGLGGNIGDSAAVIRRACGLIAALDGTRDFRMSRLYLTAPVSDLPQADYVNGACGFETSLSLPALWSQLQAIEISLGKQDKPKNAPRIIDIDILFFGRDCCDHMGLQIPHPRWHERLFVLVPLRDLTTAVHVPVKVDGNQTKLVETDLDAMIQKLSPLSPETETPCIKCL